MRARDLLIAVKHTEVYARPNRSDLFTNDDVLFNRSGLSMTTHDWVALDDVFIVIGTDIIFMDIDRPCRAVLLLATSGRAVLCKYCDLAHFFGASV